MICRSLCRTAINLDEKLAERNGERRCRGCLKIRAKIWINYWNGYDVEEFLDCGEFELDSVSLSGPPNTVTIKACSLPFTSQIRQTKIQGVGEL